MTFQSFMKKLTLFILKLFSFVPALLMLYFIFSFSAQEGTQSSQLSYRVSHKVVTVVDQVFDFNLTEKQMEHSIDKIHYYIRKTAHFMEYFILAVCVSLPLYVYGIRGIWLVLTALILCTGFACLDEYHQLFVSGRVGSYRDVIIDSSGALTGIIGTRFVGYIFRKCVFEPIFHKNSF